MAVRIIQHGYFGRMGQAVAALAAGDNRVDLVAGIDRPDAGQGQVLPVYARLEDCVQEADCVIDFSRAEAVPPLLEACMAKSLPCVLCTTGLDTENQALVERAAGSIAILQSANMSLGINLLCKLLGQTAPLLHGAGFDVEIYEKHHRQKLDAPSGTALALAAAVNSGLPAPLELVYDRSRVREKRGVGQLGIAAMRGGAIVGEHEVFFAGEDEVISFSHTAYSRSVFAKGAIEAAIFLAKQAPGLYTMGDVIGN